MNRDRQRTVGFFVLLIAVALISAYFGFWFASSKPSSKLANSEQAVNGLKLEPASIVRSQQAVAVGKVIKVDNNNISLMGADGQVGTFRLTPQVNVTATTTSASASTSAALKSKQNISSIKVATNVMLLMTLQNQVYQVTSITILPANQKI
jgi:Na+-transporting NADH:ubiquinone oxidoreductase subunit NqrC